jgi:hypothetical protein
MIWFKLKELEKQISINQFSDKDGFNYFFATTIYGFIYTSYSSISGGSQLLWISLIATIIITTIGLPMTYKINSEIDDKDFLKRFIAITWVVRMRLLILTLLFMFIYLNLFNVRDNSLGQSIFLFVFTLVINFFYYYLTIKSFKRLRDE